VVTLEILLATLRQKDDGVLSRMGISSACTVCNQGAEQMEFRGYERNGHTVRWYDFPEKGVGLNRNNALFRASGEICLLADDDVRYVDGYERVILDAFRAHPKADVILFNLYDPSGAPRSSETRVRRIHRYNCGRYGAVRIAFRRMSVLKNGISFHLLFGGGARFTAGEDTMFLRDCIRKGLIVIAVPDCILHLTDARPSTWFCGYDRKFFEDFGASYYYYYGRLAGLFTLVQLIRKRKIWRSEYSLSETWRFARQGIGTFRRLR
jgi:glycosyltransferase involved in cell wall biosynthesis